MSGRRDREGMALLTVLLLVAVMSAVAVLILDDVRFSLRRTTNADTQAQAQWYAAGAESLARSQLAELVARDPNRTPLEPRWNGRIISFPIEEGSVAATLSDGQACFNLNSVVIGQGEDLIADADGAARFVALGRALGVAPLRMQAVADALTDWLDADTQALPQGGEDARYAGLPTPYRTGGVMLAEVSELRAVANVDDALYRRLRPWVCALPATRLSINVNTLTPAQAPLLVAVTGGALNLGAAKAALSARPPAGWASPDAFWSQPALSTFASTEGMRDQTSVVTRYFDLRVDVDFAGAQTVRTALIFAPPQGDARTVIRRWTPDE